MRSSTVTVTAEDDTALFVHQWEPDGPVTGVVQIAHGMAEHAGRYARFAQRVTDAGLAVYANDHRGHGRTAGAVEELGYFADRDGFEVVVADLLAVTRRVKADHPGLPVFLYGHSMGSILARAYVLGHSDEIDGLLLSGAGGDPGPLRHVGALIAFVEGRLRGRRARSQLLDKLTFGNFNGAFAPTRTDFDWLSRDEGEVDKYVEDPYCGATHTCGFFADLTHGVGVVNDSRRVAEVRSDLPVLLFSGQRDPVGSNGAGVREVADQYRRAGLTDVTVKLYPDARHEVLNETNRDEVTDDVLAWVQARVST